MHRSPAADAYRDQVAWKSQRTRTLDLVLTQSETAHEQIQAMRDEMTRLNRDLSELHGELAKRDVELIDALARTTALTDQLRVQNEQDRAHHDRLDRAIELLTMVIASTAAPGILEAAPRADVSDAVPDDAPTPTVIGGSIDPTRISDEREFVAATIDLTIDPSDALDPPGGATTGPDRLRPSDATTVWATRG